MMNTTQCAKLLETHGFGNAAKFLHNYNVESMSDVLTDQDLISVLVDPSISQSAKIMVLADIIVPQKPEPNLNEGYVEVQNNLHELAVAQWMAQQAIRKAMVDIASQLDDGV